MDTRLSWTQRLAIRLHLIYCVWCRRYSGQIQFLHKSMTKLASIPDSANEVGSARLSQEAKDQMRQKLVQAANERRPAQ
jgi:hypothetical protein